MARTRPPIFAGSFYPEDEKELKGLVDEYLEKAKPAKIKGEIKAVISPHAGLVYSGPVAAYGYKLIKDKKINNIIILGTSHRTMFQGLALSNFAFWSTPLGNVPVSPFYKNLRDEVNFKILNEAHTLEHSIEVQLPFLQTILKDFQITPISTGRISNHKEISTEILKYLDKDTLLVVSSDLSHYLPYTQANQSDNETIEQILKLDADINHDQACGADGIIILIEIAMQLGWKAKLLDYRNSGDTSGEKTQVVGYASIIFYKE